MKDPEAKIIINHEASDWGWFTIDEIKKMDILPKVTEPIELLHSILNLQSKRLNQYINDATVRFGPITGTP